MRFVLLILAMAMSVAGRSPPDKDEQVIVVGAGLAGLSATIELLEAGNKVVLIDGEKNVGGNSAKATSGVSAYGTDVQERLGIQDSRELFYQDTMSAGDRENDETLVGVLVDDSASAIEFLTENGANLSDINLCGGHSVPRTHWFPSPKEGRPTPVGIGIIRALKAKIDDLVAANPEQLNLMLETKVLGLVSWNEYIVGVRAKLSDGQIKEITGKAVVLASGGFSADRDQQASLLLEFAPDKVRFPTTNGGFARGDGVKMARAMGAAVVGMERVQIHPTAFIDPADPDHQTKFLAAEALRGKGAILLNRKGDRFGNELGRRDYLTGKIMGSSDVFPKSFQGGSGAHVAAILLMTDETADDFGRPAFNFYANIKKFFTKYENAEALAKALEIEPSHLEKTLSDYNKLKTGEAKKDQFGKKVFPAEFPTDKPLYAALITPALHYTMGGLKIDRRAQVSNEYMKTPFKGLFAAGEVAGGVHGSNRLAGNSLLECVVFGRIAGRSASVVDYSGDKSVYHAERTEF